MGEEDTRWPEVRVVVGSSKNVGEWEEKYLSESKQESGWKIWEVILKVVVGMEKLGTDDSL